jgi:nucleoside 2-deoxyribosyltransferase
MTTGLCPVCGEDGAFDRQAKGDRVAFDCKVCGWFLISGTALELLRGGQYKDDRYKLSGAIRHGSSPDHRVKLQSDSIPELISTATPPSTPFEAIDRLILLVHQYLPSLVDKTVINDYDYPLIYARSSRELQGLLKLGEDTGFLTVRRDSQQGPRASVCGLTVDGWRRLAELRRLGQASDQAFVAMSFKPELYPAYAEGIYPALMDAGYRPFRIDREEHNDRIDDRILSELRRSGLLVADFTGHRAGVYFEAGFAKGLGLPVIWTVHEEELKDTHFDTRQYNHVTWTSPTELREKLFNRVTASLERTPRRV